MNKFTILQKKKETTPDTLQELFLKLMVRSYFPKNFKFRE